MLSFTIFSVHAQDGDLGGSSGGDSGLSQGNTAPSGDWADYSGGNDLGTNNNDLSDYQDYSGGDSSQNFTDYITDFIDSLNEQANPGGTNPGGLSPLSNMNNTVGQQGVIVSYDVPDPNPAYEYLEGGAPTLGATTHCLGNRPVIDLSWSPSPLSEGLNHDWGILKSGVVGTYRANWRTVTTFRDQYFPPSYSVFPDTVYYYRVYGYQGYFRTPLSNIIAVLTPSCAPVVTANCPNTNPGTHEVFNLSWLNNDPTASGYRLYRGTNNDVSTRAYLPPNHSAATGTFTDTTVSLGTNYNYWITSYKTVVTPGWTEVTSTDENGNPTGTLEHPAVSQDFESPYSGMSQAKQSLSCEIVAPTPTSTPIPTPSPTPTPIPSSSAPTAPPIVGLKITTPKGPYFSGGIAAAANQNSVVTLEWTVLNADDNSCVALVSSVDGSTIPASIIAVWTGVLGPPPASGGPINISTHLAGTYLFKLTCSNAFGSTPVTIQLNIDQYPRAYLKTTGGDVHSNETIYMTPP